MKKTKSLAKTEIQTILSSHNKVWTKNLVIYYQNAAKSNFRYVIAVSKKIKLKPRKNLIKRQIRSLLQQQLKETQLINIDLFIVAKYNYFESSFKETTSNIKKLLDKIALKTKQE